VPRVEELEISAARKWIKWIPPMIATLGLFVRLIVGSWFVWEAGAQLDLFGDLLILLRFCPYAMLIGGAAWFRSPVVLVIASSTVFAADIVAVYGAFRGGTSTSAVALVSMPFVAVFVILPLAFALDSLLHHLLGRRTSE